jgi:hypothetical protein
MTFFSNRKSQGHKVLRFLDFYLGGIPTIRIKLIFLLDLMVWRN